MGGELCSAIAASLANQEFAQPVSFSCGGAYFEGRPAMSALLARADLAMSQAGTQGADRHVLLAADGNTDDENGSQYWKRLIVDAIQENRFALLAQPAIRLADHGRFQLEVVGRIEKEDGELVAAAEFMPMAVRHGLEAAVDMKLVRRALDTLRDDKTWTGDIALNLSMRSLSDAAFCDWLMAALGHAPELARRLVVEIAEFGVVQDLRGTGDFVARLRTTGARFAVDHFGLHRLAFAYLQDLKPDYIKLNAALIRDLANSRENRFFISSVVNIARCLGVMTIAGGVDSRDLLPLLKDLGVEGCQGYATGDLSRIGG
jgi:EAL domain-containing protein (putative c-di-GMP-specific phosphodiesterase class I)